MNVRDLVREPLDVEGSEDRSHRNEAVVVALESVGLPSSGTFLDAFSHELSGGQLQRVALARALVVRPKLLVADEPTSMLDASEQARMLVVLRERQAEMGLGLIFVSHDMAVVRKVTDRIVVLEAGRLVEEGPSHAISTTPRSVTGRRLIESASAFSASADSGALLSSWVGQPFGLAGAPCSTPSTGNFSVISASGRCAWTMR
jgi:peptide/nickel transport system ATP-binding protein